jgi:hypothetical protein
VADFVEEIRPTFQRIVIDAANIGRLMFGKQVIQVVIA